MYTKATKTIHSKIVSGEMFFTIVQGHMSLQVGVVAKITRQYRDQTFSHKYHDFSCMIFLVRIS